MGNPNYKRWHENGRDWFAQSHDSCCFIYAVANTLIAQGRDVTNDQIEEACNIGACKTGACIGCEKVIQYFDAPLVSTQYPEEVLQQGGILTIQHPIFNGHYIYVDHECADKGALRLINSWLGPTVTLNVGKREIRPYVTNRCGGHWILIND